MSITSFPIPTTSFLTAPSTSAFAPDAEVWTRQSGAAGFVPIAKLPSSAFDVRSYGATGNGTTDDSAAIAACFAAAPAGGTIVFPNGIYLMRSMVTIAVDHLTIIGQGAKIISDGPNQDRKFNCVDRTGIRFRDLRIDGGLLTDLDIDPKPNFDTFTPNNEPGTIHFLRCKNCEVSGCDFYGLNWPVTILGACIVIKVHRNRFEQYTTGVYCYFEIPRSNDPNVQRAPKRISVTDNDFLAGKYKGWVFENPFGIYGDRSYTFNDINCSGAIKFRSDDRWFESAYHRITGNSIRESGQMGIEMQSCGNDSVIANNTISSVTTAGVSLSVISRIVVANNTIRDCPYTCIEVDGNNDADDSLPSNEQILLTGNILYGADDYGRPVNLVDNFGIVVSRWVRNTVISGGSIRDCRSGIVTHTGCRKLSIKNVRILTNLQSGYGGHGPFVPVGDQPYVQGILVQDAIDVDIVGCEMLANGNAWQRMVNIIGSSSVRVKTCHILANNTGVYINSSSRVVVQANEIELGATTGGDNVAFITLDSNGASCNDVRVMQNNFKGTGHNGISVYCPAYTVSNLTVTGNDTRMTATTSGNRFLSLGASGTGVISAVVAEWNIGGGATGNSIDVPMQIVDGNGGPFADGPAFSTLLTQWNTTINLQSAVGAAGKVKTVICTTPFNTVTLHPQSGQKINGSTSDYTFTTQWQRVVLTSDGTDWIAST
jgi:parallel beta-helix repeat protein